MSAARPAIAVWGPRAALLVVAALLAGCGEDPVEVAIGTRAPGFVLETLDGSRVDEGALEGAPSVINFWATWCQPCMKEIPLLGEVDRAGEARVIGIALDEEGARVVAPFVERMEIDYTVLLGDQKVFQRFNGFAIPYTLVLDGTRTIVNIYRGPVTREDLTRDLASIAR
jgi:thiol-disulfide isomerase/thioredoxin